MRVYERTNEAFTQVSVEIADKSLSLIYLSVDVLQGVVCPVFVGRLRTPNDDFDDAISPLIVSVRDSSTQATYQDLQRYVSIFQSMPESGTPIFRKCVVQGCQGSATFDYFHLNDMILFGIRICLFQGAQYFLYIHDGIGSILV